MGLSDSVIQVSRLGKQYRLPPRRATGRGPAARALETLAAPARRVRELFGGPACEERFWALDEVSFDVAPGEVIGIIGRNGAGKSTLLKILSRITPPTRGRAVLHGRVSSLLEVGTGFHKDLTGRENVYLNGAIHGMSRGEIDRKFDEIVSFAEVERFIDTPVKHYSSGMYMRLAFAVAAHLEPEILLVDEVLAVGDAGFQKKCLGKMGEVSRKGRTVLFVSHNMAAVQSLCSRGLLLHEGRVAVCGRIQEVVEAYLRDALERDIVAVDQRSDRSGSGEARITSLAIRNAESGHPIKTGCRLQVTIGYVSDRPLQRARFLVGVYDLSNTGIVLLDNDAAGGLPAVLPARGRVTCVTQPLNVTPGRCFVNVALHKGAVMADYVANAAHFDVESADFYGTGKLPPREWVLCVVGQDWSAEEG